MMKTTLTEKQNRHAADSTRQQKHRAIGVVAGEFNNPYTLTLLNEVTRQLNLRGASTLLLNVGDEASCQAVLRTARPLPVDALLFLAHHLSAEQLAAMTARYPLPAIHVCHSAAREGEEAIGVDDYAAGEQIGHLLLSQGYQRFGFMKGPASPSPLRRMEGYAASLQGAGKTLNSVLVAGQSDREKAYEAMMTYLKTTWASERIEGLFCENDVLAFGAMQAIRDFGEGAHIGVVGFDDVGEARSSMWSLTTWAQRGDLQITEALNRLLDQRTDEQGAWRKGELKIRHSHLSREEHGEMSQCGCASRS